MDLTKDIDTTAKDIRFGKLHIEANVHEGQVVSANITQETRQKKYSADDNAEAGKDMINILKNAQDNNRSGSLTFTAVVNSGKITRLIQNEVRQERYSPKKIVKPNEQGGSD